MNILNELNEACDYIENNIENEIDINEIARITNQSVDSISRFFVSMLGITIKEYIRKRRLSLAVFDLLNSDEKITDIAFKYGFNSYDSFCKAFLNQHNVTPTQAKNPNCEVNIFLPATFEINVKGAQKIKFKICDLEELEVFHLATDRAKGRKNRFYEIYIPINEPCSSDFDMNNIIIRQAKVEDYKDICKISCDDLGYNCDEKLVKERLRVLIITTSVF